MSYDKPVFVQNFKSVKIRSKVAIFGGKWRSKYQIFFLNPKRISIRTIASFDVFCAKICVRVSAVDVWKEAVPPKIDKTTKTPLYIPTRMQILVTIGLGVVELWCGGGVNYSLPRAHRLESSPLQHPCTTMR